MDRTLNNRRYFLYSSLSPELKNIYYKEIFYFVKRLVFEYPGFKEWYNNLFENMYELKWNREIILCEDHLKLAGVSILKNEIEEKKICTLRVAKEFQNQGIGRQLVEMSFRQLETDKPMITLHKNKFNQFETLLRYYNFELEQTQKHYYNIFSTELVFNGVLPEKEVLFHQIERIDIEQVYKKFVLMGRTNYDDFFDECVRFMCKKENIRRLKMSEV